MVTTYEKNMPSILDIINKNILNESDSDTNRGLEVILGNLKSMTPESVPIKPDDSDWKILSNPERLSRKFNFDNITKLKIFLSDLIDYQEENKHHAEITILADGIVVEVYTHELDAVTDLDKELAAFCDDVYDDLDYYFFDKESSAEGNL
jgi:pterin-4a-carbinolamine dehydratase